jgi:hypothetical protein
MRPGFQMAHEDVARLLTNAPVPRLEAPALAGPIRWRFSDRPPPAGWQEPAFDDSRWPTNGAREAQTFWARARFELDARPDVDLVLMLQGASQLELAVNGVADPRPFHAPGGGPVFAVLSEDLHHALRPGTNVVTLQALGARATATVVIEWLAFPGSPAR